MLKNESFQWPGGKRAAISLTFDDTRTSQIDCGLPILDAHAVKATFYVNTFHLAKRLDAWRQVVANGHEVGNHTLNHPCSGNFLWSRAHALEDYTLQRMAEDIEAANAAIRETLGVTPSTFAYPCGQTFVGRGSHLQSYVPLVAERFLAGCGYPDEVPNDPTFCDLARLNRMPIDDDPLSVSLPQLMIALDRLADSGGWLILVGHDVGQTDILDSGQIVTQEMLEAVCRHAQDPANGLWLDTVAAVASYIQESRANVE